jgi:hypothetical protein
MATITTPVYLEDAARTAGEAMTINGGSLTVRSDTRWHANSPASMTGTLGAVTISATLGGSYVLDGRNVRWLAYDAGSGNVPAVGTTITGGTSGAAGYLLGVWASLTSAPTAVGAAMPATGFIKLREADAAYVDNDVLSGIGATANGVDVVGWIEVVHDQNITITVPRLGDFTVRGDWFEIGTTSGSANQLMQTPTNGSTTNYVPGVWVETGVASGVYEFWPAIYAGLMIAANIGTENRSKFVCMETNGSVRFGHNGTTALGKVPASGLRVRIPNVIGREALAASRATSVVPNATAATRVDFTTTSAGFIDIENFLTNWYLLFAQPYYVKLKNVATFDYINISECATALDIDNGGNGCSQSIDARTVTLTSCFAGGAFANWNAPRSSAGTTDHAFEVLYCIGQTFTNVQAGIVTFARSSGKPFQITQSSGLTFNGCRSINGDMVFTTSFDCTINDLDYVDRYVGATTGSSGSFAMTVNASCENIVVDGMTFGLGGSIANCHPYSGVFSVANSVNCKFRNLGSKAAPLSGGSANNTNNIFISGGNNQGLKFQRIYLTPTRTGAISTLNSDKGNVYEHVYGDGADAIVLAGLNETAKNCAGTTSVTGQSSVYGTHFWDAFVSDTVGRITLPMNEPTTETAGYVTVVAGTPKFTSAGQLVMAALNDEIIFEQHYFTLGVTALTNTAPIVNGTNVTYVSGPDWGNHDIYFQYDIGAGWNGSWLDLTAANLSGVGAIDPAVGIKLKYRIVCDTASTTNAITYIRVQTDSTDTAQANNLYPLETVTLSLTGLVAGSDVVVLQSGTETVRSSVDAYGSTTWPYTYETPETVDICVYQPGYIPFFIRGYALGSSDASLPIAQVADVSYLT